LIGLRTLAPLTGGFGTSKRWTDGRKRGGCGFGHPAALRAVAD